MAKPRNQISTKMPVFSNPHKLMPTKINESTVVKRILLQLTFSSQDSHFIWFKYSFLLTDPWLYRQRRSSQSRVQKMEYDRYRAVLLETLGNARMDHSYDYIISHINTTNSPWIKRAGVHALRKYNHHDVSITGNIG